MLPARFALPKMKPSRDAMGASLAPVARIGCMKSQLWTSSEVDTKLVTAKDGGKLFGIIYRNTFGMK